MNKLLLALVLLTLTNPAIASTAELSQFNFNFFADFRYTNYHVQNNPYVASGHPESGFGLEDGAFYAKYEKNNLATIIDVAFRRSKEFDTNNSSNHPNASANNNFAIGTDKSQIYIRYKVKPNLIFNIGQFDTIFGVELNDSKDRIFGKAGLIFDNTLPSTHSGAMLEYTFLEKYYMKVLGANPNNKGSYGSSLSGDDKIELGGALGYGNEFLHTQIGYLSRKINRASSTSNGIRSLMDITVGGVLGPLALDLEYVILYDASKNTITPDNAQDAEKAAKGYLSLLSYEVTKEIMMGIRYEYLTNDPTAMSIRSSNSIGGSVHLKVNSELEFRTEYIKYNNKNISGNKWNDSRFNVATVFTL